MSEEILIREAAEPDVDGIREIFTACYSDHYAYPQYYDETRLKQLIYDRDVVFLVAEETVTGRLLGTGSVILDIGAWGDLMGEFGRLAVHPDGRGKRIGSRLMEGRIERVEHRLHVGIVENRAVHPFSQKISDHHGFTCAGFLPSKMLFAKRENVSLYIRHFGDCLRLRRNHPRIIPEAWELADEVLRNSGIGCDAIVDDSTYPYARAGEFEIEEMTSEGYTSLLHFERGRVRHREIFGPVKLHVGFFQLRISHYEYLLARRNGHLIGGIGFFVDEAEKAARILELVSTDERAIRCLLEEAVTRLHEDSNVDYVEVDVSAYSPAMQRTLLELEFLPAAYLPAMSFHRVERLDGIRMLRLFQPLDLEGVQLHEASRSVADLVVSSFSSLPADPEIIHQLEASGAFATLRPEQIDALARCASFGPVPATDSTPLVEAILVEGGKFIVFDQGALEKLAEARPDIGVVLYRDLARRLALR